jgi:V8-like Glu-specific endopeptidase
MKRAVIAFVLLCGAARADEGMWLVNDFPVELMKKSYGTAPDAKLLKKVQLGAARLANGCSASFVSDDGLVMTNHHCVRSCLEELSTPERDLLENPFVAKTNADELKCEKLELNQLVEITDVTDRVVAATNGTTGAAFAAKLKEVNAAIEGECTAGDANKRCDVVALWSGAKYHLYAYRRFRDLRLAFAPEFPMAAWGGDADNFEFPRWGIDAAFVRVWDNNAPMKTPWRLRFAKKNVALDDLVYVAGHPGGTERLSTVAELELQRDVVLPWQLIRLAEIRGRLDQWMQGDADRQRKARARLRTVENGLKALRGRFEALAQPDFFPERVRAQAELESKAPAHTKAAFDDVRKAMRDARTLYADARLLENAEAFQSDLFGIARHIVRMRSERAKPDGERLPEYTTSQLPFIEKQVLAGAPIALDLEEATLAWSLHRLRNLRGLDDPVVIKALGKETPEAVAKRIVTTTKLTDVAFRKSALDAKDLPSDPMLALALAVDDPARVARKAWEDRVDAVVKKSAEGIAEARRAVYGASGPPDATFTLRLSYGRVRGADSENPKRAMTTTGEMFSRATGAFPFALSPSWMKAKSKLAASTPVNVSTTNDIIGGNSGSPLLDRNGDVVGLIFDGNLPSLGGRYGYEPKDNRAVAVHGATLRAILKDVYDAKHILAEIER